MPVPFLRNARRVAAAVGVPLILGGCLSSEGVELVEPPWTNLQVGQVLVRSLVLVADDSAQRAAVNAAFLNEGQVADRLIEIRVEPTVGANRDPITVTPNLALPPGRLVEVGGPENTTIVLPDKDTNYRVGTFASVTLTFGRAGLVTTRVQVADPANYLAPVAPSPTPVRAP